MQSPSLYPSPSRPLSTTLVGTENMPRLALFFSTRTQSSALANEKRYNDTLTDHILTRTITGQRPLTRADHNGTIQCQVESNSNIDVFLIKQVPINIECIIKIFSFFLFIFYYLFRWTKFRNRGFTSCKFRKVKH